MEIDKEKERDYFEFKIHIPKPKRLISWFKPKILKLIDSLKVWSPVIVFLLWTLAGAINTLSDSTPSLLNFVIFKLTQFLSGVVWSCVGFFFAFSVWFITRKKRNR